MKKQIEIDIPDGWEWSSTATGSNKSDDDYQTVSVTVILKKLPVKDFDWYINGYFERMRLSKVDLRTIGVMMSLERGEYESIPFEIKIGLLKFICDDIDVDWKIAVFYDHKYTATCHIIKLSKICPEEFLKSTLNGE